VSPLPTYSPSKPTRSLRLKAPSPLLHYTYPFILKARSPPPLLLLEFSYLLLQKFQIPLVVLVLKMLFEALVSQILFKILVFLKE
jgi:hypothetical protein